MKTKEQLLLNIKACEDALLAANIELNEFIHAPENNVFATLGEAERELGKRLRGKAKDACEGSYCCGDDEYEQEFIVDGVHYMATLKVEYNRHDKTYYYVDSTDFSYKQL